ncbi:hypothetical protein [Limimaricola pyoseonensis]|uniref:Uncharacterized protein n=1 Tax=Limimaricola pyoseonensis TaxID=521013 RepID=A0A1G7C5G9_9RHOB|nr:hypothetical protein [Limimaricola pyoseonensis]SDE34548.1 hypothetical protein SAMN04488567_1364 [Limimaricola pyoseonensis]
MSHRWMFEVLADLESYALHNDLDRLAQKLSEVARYAAYEISSSEERNLPVPRQAEPARLELPPAK